MKKTLLSILAGLMVIGSASADLSPAERRALCEKNPRKYVWVQRDEFCAPINPCKSENKDIQKAYCVKAFADVQLPDPMKIGYQDASVPGMMLAEAYLNYVLHLNGGYRKMIGNDWFNATGQDYLAYDTSDGGYVVFEFDDLIDGLGENGSVDIGINEIIHLKSRRKNFAVLGAYRALGYDDIKSAIPSEDCEKILALARNVYRQSFSDILTNVGKDGLCEIGFSE